MISRSVSQEGSAVISKSISESLQEAASRQSLGEYNAVDSSDHMTLSKAFREDNTLSKTTLNVEVITVVTISLFCDYLLHTLCIPILPNAFEDMTSSLLISAVFASKPFWQFFANPIMGELVVQKGSTVVIICGTLMLSLSTFLFAYGVSMQQELRISYGIVLLARSIQGGSSAAIMTAGMTWCAVTHAVCRRGTAMGIAMTGVAAGILLGLPLGGILSYYFNYWVPFVLVAGILMVTVLFQINCYFKFQVNGHHSEEVNISSDYYCGETMDLISVDLTEDMTCWSDSSETSYDIDNVDTHRTTFSGSLHKRTASVFSLLQHPLIAFVGVLCIFANGAIGVLDPLVPVWLHDEFGMNILSQSLVFGICSLAYLVGTPFAGVMSDKYPKYICLSAGLLLFGSGMCMFLVAPVNVLFVAVAFALIGVGCACVDTPTLPLLAELSSKIDMEEDQLGVTYALSDMLLCIGFTLGPLMGSIMQSCLGGGSEGFQQATFLIGSLLLLLIPFCIIILKSATESVPPTCVAKLKESSEYLLTSPC